MKDPASGVADLIGDIAETVLDGITSFLEGLAGATSPPTPEQVQERAESREAAREEKILTAADRWRQVQEDLKNQQERENEKTQERERDEGRTRKLWGE
jgi:hypothetical protein